MNRRLFLQRSLPLAMSPLVLLHTPPTHASGEVLVIGHPGVPKVDAAALQRLYTGRAIQIGELPVTVVNAAPGAPSRDRFLASFVQMNEERYRAYWTVRRHVGKGVPPRELGSAAEIIEFVTRTPGAVGYIDADASRPGLNVIARG